MTAVEYNWETRFISHQDLMCHRFSSSIEVKTNIKTGLIKIFNDNQEIEEIDGSKMLVSDYEQLLVRIAKEIK